MAEQQETEATAKTKVLVVDDDATLIQMLELCLPDKGIEVEGAFDGMSALGKLEKKTYDAILLDLRMAPMSGLEFLEKYSAAKWGTPVVVMTGGHDEALGPFLKFPAFRALLYKPRSLQPFLDAINYVKQGATEPKVIAELNVPPVDVRTGSRPEFCLNDEDEDSDTNRGNHNSVNSGA